jgi:starch-binding outer membrane protein, SusD/RagB family
MKTIKKICLIMISSSVILSCSKLQEINNDALVRTSASGVSASDVLKSIYQGDLRNFMNQDNLWALQEHTSDECAGPTRGGDWDDNGIWRVLNQHTWDVNHNFVRGAFENLGKVVFDATDALGRNPNAQQAAEAKFLRAFANFYLIEGWDQAPYRDDLTDLTEVPKVRKGAAGLDYVISELEAAKPALPDGLINTGIANKNACRALLMKCYLTKGVVANRAAPTFATADMNKAIALADEIIGTTSSLNSNYFQNFAKDNNTSSENLFTAVNFGGTSSGGVRSRYFCTLHYNQSPSGWNGFTTLADFYDKFEAVDKRRGDSFPTVTNVTGLRVGLLSGQQKAYLRNKANTADSLDGSGNRILVNLKDRKGGLLSFTRNVKAIETDPNTLEVTGIRVVKYPPDYTSGDDIDNDYVFLRLADVLLMKSEAILRGGTATTAGPYGSTALSIVNYVRTQSSRNASALATLTLDQLIDERGRELYWEGWRRMDLIRFGKFNAPTNIRSAASASTRNLFPVPAQQIAVNPNLSQNPGY